MPKISFKNSGNEPKFNKPRLVVSKCLEFEPVRFNGQKIRFPFIEKLQNFVDFIPICPEVEIGLGTPRFPVRIIRGDDIQLVQPKSGLNYTKQIIQFSKHFLSSYTDVDGYILKYRSPSCGIKGVKYYNSIDSQFTNRRGPGIFAKEILDCHKDLAVEDEKRLLNYKIREHFLTKLFIHARFRVILHSNRIKDLQ